MLQRLRRFYPSKSKDRTMTKYFQDLTAIEISELNSVAWDQITVSKVKFELSDLVEFLGLREATSEETPHFLWDSRRYVMENSRTNRPISMESVKGLIEMIESGRWCINGEPFIRDNHGQIASAQHRALAKILCNWKHGTSEPYYAILVDNVPVEFVDTIDTGRVRAQKDIFARDPDILAVESLLDLNGKSWGDKSQAIRKTLLGELTTACNFLRLRSSGKNIQTGGQAKRHDLHKIRRAFDSMELGNTLESLVALVYKYDLGQSDSPTWSKTINRPVMVAALALWSMRESEPWAKNGNWIGTIDLEGCEDFLRELSISNAMPDGRLSEFIAELQAAKGQKKTEEGKIVKSNSRNELKREYIFGALVNAIRLYFAGDPVKGCIPKGKKDAKTYPAFGGVDCGYIAPVRGRKSEESDDSDE